MLFDINLHKPLLSLLLDLREKTILLAAMVVRDHLIPAQTIPDEIFIILRFDVRSLEVDTGFC